MIYWQLWKRTAGHHLVINCLRLVNIHPVGLILAIFSLSGNVEVLKILFTKRNKRWQTYWNKGSINLVEIPSTPIEGYLTKSRAFDRFISLMLANKKDSGPPDGWEILIDRWSLRRVCIGRSGVVYLTIPFLLTRTFSIAFCYVLCGCNVLIKWHHF